MLYILALCTIIFEEQVKQTRLNFNGCVLKVSEPGKFSRYSDSLQAGGSGEEGDIFCTRSRYSRGVNRPERRVDHLPASNVEVK